MTPYEIGILLHYYCRAEDHEDMQRNPPGWRLTIDAFLADGVLQHGDTSGRYPMVYMLTERGRVYVDALRQVPLPEPSWVIRWADGHEG